MNALKPELVSINLAKGEKHEHPDIDDTGQTTYLAQIGGDYFSGTFSRAWYGLVFDGWAGKSLQFDAPTTNHSSWEALWEIKRR